MKKDVSLFLLIAVSIPSLSMVGCVPVYTNESARQIAKAADNDARVDARVDACLWLSGGFCLGVSGGCLLGSVGIVGAYFYEPSLPPTRLLGKPPEYIDSYIQNYKGTRSRIALSGACLGCAAGAIVAGGLVTPWATALGVVAGRMADKRGW